MRPYWVRARWRGHYEIIVMNKAGDYRRGNKDDLQQLKELGIASYSVHMHALEQEWQEQLFHSLSDEATYTNLLAISTPFVHVIERKIVGMAFYVPSGNPTDIYPADWSYIRFVGVYPEFHGKGIAKHLTRMCINEAKLSGEHTIGLHTSEFMHAARHIYESMGFRKIKEIPPRYGKAYWLYSLQIIHH